MKTKTRTIALSIVTMLLLVCPAQTSRSDRPVSVSPVSIETILQPTATISGTIRHDGSPVSGVVVIVDWSSGGQDVTTGADGVYSVSGVPTGGWIQIFVRPPTTGGLAFRNWRTDNLAGDLVKDFDLEDGYRLQGEFRQPDGTPYAQDFWLGLAPLDFSPPEGERIGDSASNGQFDLVVAPGIYTLRPGLQPPPYHAPHTKADLRSSDRMGLVVTLLDEPPPPFPIAPPNASKITVGEPDVEGYATVTGAAGAVEPLSAVALVNLSAYTVMTTTSDANGAFAATLYAPPGSSLLVKYDFYGDRVMQLWRDAYAYKLAVPTYLNPLPGTILYVGAPPVGDGSSQAFYSVGAWGRDHKPTAWAGWWLFGTLQVPLGGSGPGLAVQQGQPVTFTARVRVTAPALNCTGTPTPTVQASVHLRYLFGDDGHAEPWDIGFNSHLFTPTGLPIEHEASGELPHMAGDSFTSLTCVSPHVFEGTVEIPFTVPADLPDGVYRLESSIWSDTPLSDDVPLTEVWYHEPEIAKTVSLVVGDPAPPHIPWMLLGDDPVNGHRGVQAREDAGYFQMVTRVLFPPHTVVVPMLNERTGAPLVYRLEPGSHWLAASERRTPNPPHLPLALPSGSLTVQVHKPDGSVDTLGPATIRQSSVRTPTTPGGNDIDEGTGQVSDLYHLTTLDDAFDYSFDQYGPHVIILEGEVEDIYGNTYPIQSTYDVTVARVLDLDPAQLPTTPYEQGDAFAPGLHLFPPVPADVTVRLVYMPLSNPAAAITETITGQANRFGYFQPPAGTEIRFELPGEFRVDLTAVYTDPDGALWMGTMTWGNVVEGPAAQIEAHGRRGLDYKSDTIDDMPAWFEVFNLPPEKLQGAIEVYYPYFSGDVHWGDETPGRAPGDSIHAIITIKDLTGASETCYNILRNHFSRARNCFRWPPEGCTQTGFEKRVAIGEAPLFITTKSGIDPGVDPDDIDLWGYWYGSSERPDVRVREIVSEDGMGTAYWRFDDTYGYQIGEPADGDHPGDIKWEFGGVVFRTITETNPINEYAIYSSLWVLLPHNDPIGARITPPFQDATGAGINGGPILTMTVQGQVQEIDMLFLPKGVRPGDVLEVGDMVAFSGHVGPPLDSRVSVTITSPSNVQHAAVLRANKIGWVYDPGFDFPAEEPGRWTVDVLVLHDRPYVGNGVIPLTHNTGTVMGTTGRYEFYVVEPGSPRLSVSSPQPGFVTWPRGEIEPIHIRGTAPAGTTTVHYTIHDKGVVMGQGTVAPDASGVFTVTYDAKALHESFSMLSLTAHEGRWEGLADEVAINLLAVGGAEPRGNTVTLIGEEVFIGNDWTSWVYLPVVLKGG